VCVAQTFFLFFVQCLVLRVLLLPVPAFGLLTAHVAKDDDKTEADAGHYHSADAVEFVALEYAVVTILVTRPATTREAWQP